MIAKLLALLTWALTLLVTIDFLARFGLTLRSVVMLFSLSQWAAVIALGLQAVLLGLMTLRVLLSALLRWSLPGRRRWVRGLLLMTVVAGAALWVCETFAGSAERPLLLTGWWAMVWAYLALVAIPLSPIVLIAVQGVPALRWRLLTALLSVAGASCTVGWTMMI